MVVAGSETRFPTTPSFRLDGQRALVTGASKGIGRAVAIAFAEAGAEVLLTARSLPEMEATVEGLAAKGLAARARTLDATDRAAVRALVDAEGPFDILFNNAGTNIRKPFLEASDASIDALIDLNIRAAITVAQAVARGMVAAGKGGAIINVSSVNGHVAGVNRSIYTASKHAIEGLTKAMAVELGAKGIRVNAICPTFIETPLTAGVLSDKAFLERTIRAIPIGRIGQVEDVMGAAVFLASPAAALINGASLLIDGGLVCV
ncbi:SDR family oxidoreductase [Elioraea tepida]|uniref:SDR family oxidoreductase n=1 Tax=Elioraea tepida TaxID=2843330 RepID=A0A975YJP2_9PROT|nr:SDR family oxidoreductase [Elioraea tepida]QXM24879.1 SDR family oxidoreductase [Elioraea tepida]